MLESVCLLCDPKYTVGGLGQVRFGTEQMERLSGLGCPQGYGHCQKEKQRGCAGGEVSQVENINPEPTSPHTHGTLGTCP